MREAQLPVRRVVVKAREERRKYDVTVHAPYRFAEEIATAQPHLSNRFAVNLDAGDACRPTTRAAPVPGRLGGLAVEGDRDEALLANLPAPSIRKLIGTVITPDNVAELLADNGCPETPIS